MFSALPGTIALGLGIDPGGDVRTRLEGERVAVMLFGSCARGDQNASSDVDVLQLVERWRPSYETGRFSVSVYTCARLLELARTGSLFVLHLVTEGRTIEDPTGELSRILTSYRQPASYEGARNKLQRAACVLDIDRIAFDRNPEGFLQVGLHILRTALYVRCVETGNPIFSMPRVARHLGQPRIAEIFVRREPRSFSFFLELRAALRHELGIEGRNEYGSLEALAVAMYEACPIASYFALKLLDGGARIEYDRPILDWVSDV
jgi:nucleotidyltransferase-like protein